MLFNILISLFVDKDEQLCNSASLYDKNILSSDRTGVSGRAMPIGVAISLANR